MGHILPNYNLHTASLFRVDPHLTEKLLGKALRAANSSNEENPVKLPFMNLRFSLYFVIIFNNKPLHWTLYNGMSLHLNSVSCWPVYHSQRIIRNKSLHSYVSSYNLSCLPLQIMLLEVAIIILVITNILFQYLYSTRWTSHHYTTG